MLGAALTAVTLTAIAFNPNWPPDRTDLPAEAFARPDAMPDDPEFAPGADGCGGQHGLYGFVPDCASSVAEPRVGSAVDRAWVWTTGHPSVVIAPLGDGVDWSDADLVGRWALDPGEVPAPETSSVAVGHDVNGDGAFDVRDYTNATGTVAPTLDRVIDATLLARADRGDVNGNGLLDPQDILRIFSNGVDDDGDGYVDDIAGWDHVDDDNDPGVVGGASRAARTIAGQANNGIGGAGVCPDCRLLPLRVARRGRAFANPLALALRYASDQGVTVVASFVEALEATALLAAATNDAIDEGVLIVAAAGDGPRRPVAWDPDRVLFVGGVGYDADDARDATTSLAPDPCAGFGAHLALAGPGRCDEGGAAVVAGIAALVASAARGIPERGVAPIAVGPDALRTLLTSSAEDVRPEETEAPALSPATATRRGWDERTGAGRVDALAAIEALVRRELPSAARITTPPWYAVIDPTTTNRLRVAGRVEVTDGERVTWTLAAAAGAEPELDTFQTIASGTIETSSEVEGELDVIGLFADTAAAARTLGAYQVTVQLSTRRTMDGEAIVGETRRAFSVHRDLALLPGYPVDVGAGVVSGPRVVELDGAPHVVVATVDGELLAYDRFGERSELLNVQTPTSTRTGAREVIFATFSAAMDDGPWFVVRGLQGTLTVVDPSGTSRTIVEASGFGATSSPALFDLDGDGAFEIITSRGFDVFVRRRDGTVVDGWPQRVDGASGTPSIGDVDGDGAAEIVVATATQIYVFEADGTLTDDAPLRLPVPDVAPPARFFAPSAALGDLDGDGRLDIVAPVLGGAAVQVDTGARTVTTARSTSRGVDVAAEGPPLVGATNAVALGRIAGDSPSTVLMLASVPTLGGLGAAEVAERAVGSFDDDGDLETGFPRAIEGGSELDVLLADIDGDGRPELLFSEADRLRAVAYDGSRPPGFAKLTGDEVVATPVVEDLDGDGLLELVAVTRTGRLFVWRTRGVREGVAWNGHHHDLGATGNLSVEALVTAPGADTSGCGCHAASGRRGEGLLALVFLTLFLRRRR